MMTKVLAKAVAIFDRTNDIFAALATAVLVFVWLSVCFEVIMRFFLNRPQGWVVEISEYCLLYITFLGAAWLLKREGHVKIDWLQSLLNPKKASLLNLVTSVVGAILCLALVWWGSVVTWDFFHRGIVSPGILDFPQGPVLIIIPIGSSLLSVQFLRKAHRHLIEWRIKPSTG